MMIRIKFFEWRLDKGNEARVTRHNLYPWCILPLAALVRVLPDDVFCSDRLKFALCMRGRAAGGGCKLHKGPQSHLADSDCSDEPGLETAASFSYSIDEMLVPTKLRYSSSFCAVIYSITLSLRCETLFQ